MKHVVCDSSSLILMSKASILEEFLENKKIYITRIVHSEAIERGKKKGRKDAYILEGLKRDGKIKVENPKEKKMKEIEELFNLHKGEKEALALASELNLPLICDDKKGYNASQVLEIESITALNVLESLFESDKISEKKAINSLDKLEKFGWYKEELIKNVRSKIGD